MTPVGLVQFERLNVISILPCFPGSEPFRLQLPAVSTGHVVVFPYNTPLLTLGEITLRTLELYSIAKLPLYRSVVLLIPTIMLQFWPCNTDLGPLRYTLLSGYAL